MAVGCLRETTEEMTITIFCVVDDALDDASTMIMFREELPVWDCTDFLLHHFMQIST